MPGNWSDNFADPNWWPTPPPRPPKAPSALKIALVAALAAAAAGAVFALTRYVHTGPRAAVPGPAPAAALRVSAPGADRRQAFRDCMRSLHAGSGPGGGRFGGGPSKSVREAFAICRSLLAGGTPAPAAPQPAATTPAAPVA